MFDFKVGDIVEFIYVGDANVAKAGATAEVIANDLESNYISIRWDRTNLLCGNQIDGGYYKTDFKLISRKNPFILDEEVITIKKKLVSGSFPIGGENFFITPWNDKVGKTIDFDISNKINLDKKQLEEFIKILSEIHEIM